MLHSKFLATFCLVVLALFILKACQTNIKQSSQAREIKEITISDARIVLRHFVEGNVPTYAEYGDEQEQPTSDILSLPGYCFARCLDSETCDVYSTFQVNTEMFILPFAKAVQRRELTERSYLNEQQTVEKWMYEDHWAVIANFGEEDYLHERTLLPQYGFIAVGPNYIAQHYYSNAEDKTTRLFVKYEDQEYIGFE